MPADDYLPPGAEWDVAAYQRRTFLCAEHPVDDEWLFLPVRHIARPKDGALVCGDCWREHYGEDMEPHRWCPRCGEHHPWSAFGERPPWGAGWWSPTLHRRCETCRAPKQPSPITCERCGNEFTPTRTDARFCSGRCRVAAHRAQRT